MLLLLTAKNESLVTLSCASTDVS